MVRSASLKDPVPQTHHEQNSENSRDWDDNESHATVRPDHKLDEEEYIRGQQQSRLGHNGRESAAGQYRDRDDRRDTRETRDTRHTNYTADQRQMGRDSHQTQQTQHTYHTSQHTHHSNSEHDKSQDQHRPLPPQDRYGGLRHKRNESEATGHHTTATNSSNGYPETALSNSHAPRHYEIGRAHV